MKFNRPLFWNEINLISILLFPLSLIVFLINIVKKFSLKKILKLNPFVLGIYILVVLEKHLYRLK